jgi:hypothetical protein
VNTVRLIKEAVRDRLKSWPPFAGIPIFTDHTENLRGEVDAALDKNRKDGVKGGAYGIICIPSTRDMLPNVTLGPNRHALVVQFQEELYDNLGPNGFGVTGDDFCTDAKELLKAFAVADLCYIHSPERVYSMTPPDPLNSLRTSTLSLVADDRSASGAGFPLGIVATPAAVLDSGSAALTCGTDGSSIYYSLDGTYPSAAHGATLFTGSFTVTNGQALRACAYKTNFVPSNVLQQLIT